jgi:hypothetical protein
MAKDNNKTYLRFEYNGVRWWLNDDEINEENFSNVQEKEPNKEVNIKRFMQISKVKISDIKVTGMSGSYIPTNYTSEY